MAKLTPADVEKRISDYEAKAAKISRRIIVCGGTGCVANGSLKVRDALVDELKRAGQHVEVDLEHDSADHVHPGANYVSKSGCQGFCQMGPLVRIEPDGIIYTKVHADDAREIVQETILKHGIIERLLYLNPTDGKRYKGEHEIPFYSRQHRLVLANCTIEPDSIGEYFHKKGYLAAIKAYTQMTPEQVCSEMEESGLRGRGGGGFPTGRKWKFTLASPGPKKYVICNGDEGDPGAFMDRSVMEGNPHAVIEGMMIAARAIGADEGYVYVRAEYPLAVLRMRKAVKDAEEAGVLGDDIFGSGLSFRIHVMEGAGAFVCGEETALLNSIEGQRGMPRPRPPFPAVKGLWQKPSIINNVETLACVPYILREGAEKFASYGTDRSKGTKVFALGGKINNVGLVEVPMGTTLRELIYDIGGGIPNGKKFKAIQTGGPSGGCLTEADLDAEIDYDNLIAKGSMMGSGGAIVMDEDNCMVDVAKFYMEFICDESCGKCTPCRIGTKRMLELLTKITDGKATMDDLAALEDLAHNVKNNSLCGLGQTAPNPVLSTLSRFRDEYVAHIVEKKCPAHVCKHLMKYEVIKDKCFGCGLCERQCPVGAISKTDYVAPGKKLPARIVDQEKCIKCGMCMASCKFKAIEKK